MPMSPRLLRPRASGDPDAGRYIAAVQTADGQALEPAVRQAIEAFVRGCKRDGTWSAIKASCILMGARTLSGALTPLVGTAPTNNGPFVSGDYNRRTGLVGNGTSKYLDSNYTIALQNNRSMAVYVSSPQTSGLAAYLGSTDGLNARSQVIAAAATSNQITTRFADVTSNTSAASNNVAGFIGVSRGTSASYVRRAASADETVSVASTSSSETTLWVFARPVTSSEGFTSARIAFYYAGESLNLALLDSRVSALYTAIGAAIP